MSYNIGLKTTTEKQAKDIYHFVKNKVVSLDILKPSMFNIKWMCGTDMAYINQPNYFGAGYSTLDGFKAIYFFSIMYHVAIKFNLYEEINNNKVVTLNYDDDELFYLSKSNPFDRNDSRYLSFIQINEEGIQNYKRKGWRRIFGNKISQEEVEFIKDNIKIIHQAKI